MKRATLIQCKEKTLDRMMLCASVFLTNTPPTTAQCIEMHAHAALLSALCVELGPPLPIDLKPAFDRAALQRCVERLAEYVANEASPTRLVEDSLAELRRLLEGRQP